KTLKREVTAGPVLRAAASGGLVIGRALDRSLPALREAAAHLPAGPAAAACDVADQRPLLCVNGTGPNAMDAEAVLVVDLGGDDTYTSSAGGASSARCLDDPEDTSCNASVLVDLGGDDTYVLDGAISHDHMVGAGSALTGVGILVDAAGDDAYLARVPDRPDSLDQSYVFGSGNTGLGLLADLAGDDRYELTGASKDTFAPYTHGASLTGMGALLDMDGANTYRTVITGPQPDDPERPLIENDLIQSMGVGVFGGGALVDRTGYATFEARVDITAGQREETNSAGVAAQGVGLIGDAALFAGAGPTTYRAEARRVASAQVPGRSSEPEPDEWGEIPPTGRLPGAAAATAQGVAALGFVVMEDAGGDDTYLDHARSEHHLTAVAEDGCGCDRAIATLDVTGDYSASAGVSTQGVGSAIFAPDAGVILHDRGGDDTYSARAEMIITSRAENRLADPSAGARAEAIPYNYPGLNAFGQGLGSDFAPTVLQDDGGDDTYELITLATTDASADAGQGPATARSVGSQPNTHGQGSSYWDPAHGALIDLGGRDDYQAHAISRATTSPNPGAWDVPRTIAAQGGVGGTLVDVDEGIADTFAATPERGPGVGVRGEGPGWVDVL
ncbi:MAG TPA: hypothetical protein VGB28_06195, partial [Actinomycetota bacterium]